MNFHCHIINYLPDQETCIPTPLSQLSLSPTLPNIITILTSITIEECCLLLSFPQIESQGICVFCVTSFVSHYIFRIHSCCCIQQQFVYFLCCVVFYCRNISQFVYTFYSFPNPSVLLLRISSGIHMYVLLLGIYLGIDLWLYQFILVLSVCECSICSTSFLTLGYYQFNSNLLWL